MTIVINILGGSGIGKSTTAADLFSKMKYQNYNVELVTEYVKKWAWQKRTPHAFDQAYLFGKQSQSESLLYSQVDYIVTDSPILLAGYYEYHNYDREIILPAVLNFLSYAKEQGVEHKNFFLKRLKPFNPLGRYETAEQATFIDQDMKLWLEKMNVSFIEIESSDQDRAETILSYLEKEKK